MMFTINEPIGAEVFLDMAYRYAKENGEMPQYALCHHKTEHDIIIDFNSRYVTYQHVQYGPVKDGFINPVTTVHGISIIRSYDIQEGIIIFCK